MKKQLVNLGFLAFYGSSKALKSFRSRANQARKVGIRLCLIETSLANIAAIKNKKDIRMRVWNGKSIEELIAPAPLVVYDRARPLKSPAHIELTRHALQFAGCHFLNSLELLKLAADKWEQYIFFALRNVRIPLTTKYLPSALREYLKRGMVFIKPRSGSLGRNQIIITPKSKGYQVTTTFGRKKSYTMEGLKSLLEFLSSFFLENHIIQQGIDIDQIEERTKSGIRMRSYDFRVVVQRISATKLIVPFLYVRVGAINSRQANISRGGHAQDPKSVFSNHKTVTKELTEFGKKLFLLLEKKYLISEIGFDFVCDKNGEYWLIEINCRPGTQGPRELRELVLSDTVKKNSRIVFDEQYSNEQRKKWGRNFEVFCASPFRFAREIHLRSVSPHTEKTNTS